MLKSFLLTPVAVLTFLSASLASAQATPADIRALRDRVAPALVAVQFTWAYEYGRIEFVTPGVIVSDDGLTLISLAAVAPALPDKQMIEFKLIIPGGDNDDDELDAVFQGRDERTNLAFVRPKESGRQWKPVTFEDEPVDVGERVLSVGLMPKSAGYRAYVNTGLVSAKLRGEVPAWMVTGGGLANIGAPVFNQAGKAIGFVNLQQNLQPFLYTSAQNPRQQINTMAAVINPPCLFIPASEVLLSLKSPPTPEQPIVLPWIGTPQLTGLEQEVAEAFGLKNTPAIEVGDIVPGGPADRAGVKVGMKIIKLNGQPLERGDEPEELPDIFARNLRRQPIGSEVTLTVMTTKDEPTQDIKIKLEPRPRRQNELPRFWTEDLAFSTRDITFDDAYARKQPSDLKGVVVSITKREGAAAAAGLEINDIITTLNGNAVSDMSQFETAYKALRKEKPSEPIVLVVLKPDATTKTIKIEAPR